MHGTRSATRELPKTPRAQAKGFSNGPLPGDEGASRRTQRKPRSHCLATLVQLPRKPAPPEAASRLRSTPEQNTLAKTPRPEPSRAARQRTRISRTTTADPIVIRLWPACEPRFFQLRGSWVPEVTSAAATVVTDAELQMDIKIIGRASALQAAQFDSKNNELLITTIRHEHYRNETTRTLSPESSSVATTRGTCTLSQLSKLLELSAGSQLFSRNRNPVLPQPIKVPPDYGRDSEPEPTISNSACFFE